MLCTAKTSIWTHKVGCTIFTAELECDCLEGSASIKPREKVLILEKFPAILGRTAYICLPTDGKAGMISFLMDDGDFEFFFERWADE